MDFDDLDDADANASERVFNLDEEGVPRGACKCCDCSEWLCRLGGHEGRDVPPRRRAYNVTVPTPATVRDMMRDAEAGIEVSWRTLATLGGQIQALEEREGASEQAPPGCCRRCGCPATEHFNLSGLARQLLTSGELSEVESTWDDLERALFVQTRGFFRPASSHDCSPARARERIRGARGQSADVDVLVSVICPTGGQRHAFHPCLYQRFCEQTHTSKELVVVDTCEGDPSEFFTQGPPARDPRVIYRHFAVPSRAWSVGAKRNIACRLAHGHVVAHFDDDDLYGPGHLERMLKAMREGSADEDVCVAAAIGCEEAAAGSGADVGGRGGAYPAFAAEAAALSSWYTFDLDSGSFGGGGDRQGSGSSRRPRKRWSFGWGFCHVYLWDAWRARWFRDVTQGEDGDFLDGLLARGWRVAVLDDREGHCAHTHHGTNTSFRERQWPLPPGALEGSHLPRLGMELQSAMLESSA